MVRNYGVLIFRVYVVAHIIGKNPEILNSLWSSFPNKEKTLTFTTHFANSADNKLVIIFLNVSRKQNVTFHANLSPLKQD